MTILLVLIPISFLFLLLAIGVFIWAMRNRQFENLDSAALDILTSESDPKEGTLPEHTDAD